MNNINQIMQLVRNGNNPQSMLTSLLEQKYSNTPMGRNLINMINTNNTQGIESMARNLCKERGLDADELINQIKSYSR